MTASFDGKRRALVTGASAGLGAEFAHQLAAMGSDLVLVARREERLNELADQLSREYGVHAAIIVADLEDPTAPKLVADMCSEHNWQIDWLINNAGIAGPDLLNDRDWSEQQTFFQLMML